MKLLMSNSKNPNLLAPQYASYFKLLGVDVIDFFQSDFGNNFRLIHKVIYKIYPQYFHNHINQSLLNLVFEHKPDVLLIFKGMETYPQTLKKIKEMGVILVNYNPDHPFDYVSKGSGNKNVLNSIPLYDMHITYSHKIEKDLKQKYPSINTALLPFGFELNQEDFKQIEKQEEILKVGFVGFADRDRADFINFLLENDIEVDVYGEKWDSFFKLNRKGLNVYKSVAGLEYYKTLRKYRVQLNIFRNHNEDSHNMRSFEVPGAGGIMLAPSSYEHRLYFDDNTEVFLYKSKEDALNLINYLINLPVDKARQIRFNARQRSISSGYSYQNRTQQLKQILLKALN